MKWAVPLAIVAAVAYWLAKRPSSATQDDMHDQTPSWAEQALNDMLTNAPTDNISQNERAFLDMIAYSEGTANGADNGYGVLFGGGSFSDYSDHPRQVFTFTNKAGQTLKTTAAGRYQFLARTWDEVQSKLDLPDFGPHSQDLAALELVRQRGALDDVRAGNISAAVTKCAPIWASLPGAGYNQQERKLSSLLVAYQAAGGNLEA